MNRKPPTVMGLPVVMAILATLAMILFPVVARGAQEPSATPQPKRNPNIGYMSTEIPAVRVVPPRGERYQALVPDTLDLAERAELAIHAVTNLVDPEADYEMYFLAQLCRRPPIMTHNWDDVVQFKCMEALPFLRLITGSQNNLEVDQRWMEVVLHMRGPDGLPYWPVEGRPWGGPPGGWADPVIGDRARGQYAISAYLGRQMAAMTVYGLRDGNPVWKQSVERMVQRLSQLVVDKGDYAYFPAGCFAPGAEAAPDAGMPTHGWATLAGWVIQGLAQHYRATGYEPARDLAEKLVHYVKDPRVMIFDSQGAFVGIGHFHHHTAVVLGMAEFALATGDGELAEFVRKCYEHGKSIGDPLVGFFPEGLRAPDGSYTYAVGVQSSETCEVADMVAIGLKLAEMGYDDCWDDVDRWIRNQFAENQMVRADWVYRMLDTLDVAETPVGPYETGDRVPERSVGAFAGWPVANDFLPTSPGWAPGFMHCCLGNGTRAIYYAWEHILRFEDGTLRINLLLNRASPWADVDSYIPYEGRVDVKVKAKCRLEVRIPEWVKPEETACRVNAERRRLTFRGRYARVGAVNPGDVAAITFPISERTVKTTIGGVPYILIIKGNDVVSIDPPGKWCPLYQRAHYRENRVRWVERERFVASQIIDW